jgi:hypothetical protein
MLDRECISSCEILSLPVPLPEKSWHHNYHMSYSGSIKAVLGANVFIVKTLDSGQVLEPMILKQVVQPGMQIRAGKTQVCPVQIFGVTSEELPIPWVMHQAAVLVSFWKNSLANF